MRSQNRIGKKLRAAPRVKRGNTSGREEPRLGYLEVPSGFQNTQEGICEPADCPGVLSLNSGPPREQPRSTGSGKGKWEHNPVQKVSKDLFWPLPDKFCPQGKLHVSACSLSHGWQPREVPQV